MEPILEALSLIDIEQFTHIVVNGLTLARIRTDQETYNPTYSEHKIPFISQIDYHCLENGIMHITEEGTKKNNESDHNTMWVLSVTPAICTVTFVLICLLLCLSIKYIMLG